MKIAYLNLIVALCAVVCLGLTHNPLIAAVLIAVIIANLFMIAVNVARPNKRRSQ